MVEQPVWSRWFNEFDGPEDERELGKPQNAAEKAQKQIARSVGYVEDEDSRLATDITTEVNTMGDAIERLVEIGQDALNKYAKLSGENDILKEMTATLLTMLGGLVIDEAKIDSTLREVSSWCALNFKDDWQAFYYDRSIKTYVPMGTGYTRYREKWDEQNCLIVVPTSDSDRVLLKLRWG